MGGKGGFRYWEVMPQQMHFVLPITKFQLGINKHKQDFPLFINVREGATKWSIFVLKLVNAR